MLLLVISNSIISKFFRKILKDFLEDREKNLINLHKNRHYHYQLELSSVKVKVKASYISK